MTLEQFFLSYRNWVSQSLKVSFNFMFLPFNDVSLSTTKKVLLAPLFAITFPIGLFVTVYNMTVGLFINAFSVIAYDKWHQRDLSKYSCNIGGIYTPDMNPENIGSLFTENVSSNYTDGLGSTFGSSFFAEFGQDVRDDKNNSFVNNRTRWR